MKKQLHLSLLTGLLFGAAALFPATAPAQMNYQGRLTDPNGTAQTDGQYTLTFNLYTAASGGTLVWGPFVCDGNAGVGRAPKADLVTGRFNVILGSLDTASRPLATAFTFGAPRYLGIKVGSVNPPEILPRQQILAAPEALHAQISDTVTNGAIGTAQIADGSITAIKINGGTGVWVGSGNNIYHLNGNVGIGTATPGAKLDVAGNANVTGNASVTGKVGIGSLPLVVPYTPLDIASGGAAGTGNASTLRLVGPGGTFYNGLFFQSSSATQVGIDFAPFEPALGGSTTPSAQITATDDGLGSASLDFLTRLPAFPVPALGPSVSRMTITSVGNVGIGTTTPTQGKLVVNGWDDLGFDSPNGYFNASQGAVANSANQNIDAAPISIYASHRIAAEVYYALSDQRIKEITGRSDGATDLHTLLGIEITDYRYKDAVSRGNASHKKVIAQQVEKVFPQAVTKGTDVVPDIYQKAAINDGWVMLATDLKKGDRVRLIGEKAQGIHEVLEVSKDKFRTDFKGKVGQVFVYGREVNDFRTVDYEAISMLNVSATQELARRLEKVEARESHVAELERELADLKKLVARLAQAGKAGKQAAVSNPQGVPSAKDASLQAPSATASQER